MKTTDDKKFQNEIKKIKNSVKEINTKRFNEYKKIGEHSLCFDYDYNFIKIDKTYNCGNLIKVNLFEYTSKQDVIDELTKYTER